METIDDICKELGVTRNRLLPLANSTLKNADFIQDDNADNIKDFKTKRGKIAEHYSPKLTTALAAYLNAFPPAPKNWLTEGALTKQLGVGSTTAGNVANAYKKSNPDWFKLYRDSSGHINEHMAPELCKIIEQKLTSHTPAPKGWKTVGGLSKELGIDRKTINKLISLYRNNSIPISAEYLDGSRNVRTFISPSICALIRDDTKIQ